MAYKKQTPFFGIPVVSKGEKIEEAEEYKAANIIENQLIAGLKGINCVVFEEGKYDIIDHHDGTFAVALTRTTNEWALCGVVGGAYCESTDPLLWDGLSNNRQYYLYVQHKYETFANEKDFIVLVSAIKRPENMSFLLLAEVDLRDGKQIINTKPLGKIYSSDVASHVKDTENPHGEELTQDKILSKRVEIRNETESAIVLGKSSKSQIKSEDELKIGDARCDVQLSDNDNKELLTANKTILGAINELYAQDIYIAEVDSGGVGGVLMEIPDAKEIMYVTAHELVLVQNGQAFTFSNLGQVAVGYFGKDGNVSKTTSFKLYNSGNTGIKLKVIVYYK